MTKLKKNNINKIINLTNKLVKATNNNKPKVVDNDESSLPTCYVFCRYIKRNGKIIYPKEKTFFRIPLSELTKKKKGGDSNE